MVNCTEVGNAMNTSSAAESRSAVITINFVQEKPDSPIVMIRNNSTRFWRHNVSVILDWIPEFNTLYSVSAVPPAQIIVIESDAHVTVSYNIPYNVSIVATLCGLDSTPTNVQQIMHGE